MRTYRSSLEYAVERDGDEAERIIVVDYVFWPASKGPCERGGLQISPDDPAEIEITSATNRATGLPETLTEDDIYNIEVAAFEKDAEDNREYEPD